MSARNIDLAEFAAHHGTPPKIAPPERHKATLTCTHHSDRSAIRICPMASNYSIGKDFVPSDQPQQIMTLCRISLIASPTPSLPELTDTPAGPHSNQLGEI
jgi:hypothetical protein